MKEYVGGKLNYLDIIFLDPCLGKEQECDMLQVQIFPLISSLPGVGVPFSYLLVTPPPGDFQFPRQARFDAGVVLHGHITTHFPWFGRIKAGSLYHTLTHTGGVSTLHSKFILGRDVECVDYPGTWSCSFFVQVRESKPRCGGWRCESKPRCGAEDANQN